MQERQRLIRSLCDDYPGACVCTLAFRLASIGLTRPTWAWNSAIKPSHALKPRHNAPRTPCDANLRQMNFDRYVRARFGSAFSLLCRRVRADCTRARRLAVAAFERERYDRRPGLPLELPGRAYPHTRRVYYRIWTRYNARISQVICISRSIPRSNVTIAREQRGHFVRSATHALSTAAITL